MASRVAVIGAGSWGTAVAAIAATNTPTVLWARRAELAEQIAREHENGDYLAGLPLPESLEATSDVHAATADADVIVEEGKNRIGHIDQWLQDVCGRHQRCSVSP